MRILLSLLSLLVTLGMSAQSKASYHSLLEEGKSWVYDYHHFEEHENEPTTEKVYPVRYTLLGDTLIGDKSYYKMYQEQDNQTAYYGAYREEGLKVFARFPLIDKDIIVADFEYKGLYDPDGYNENDSYSTIKEYIDYIEVDGIKYRRHTYYESEKEDRLVIGVEGIGYTKYGLKYPSIYGPEPDCLCDYEVFASCELNGKCIFTNEDFYKEAVAQELVIDCIFTMSGDTEINGKTYKKVYCQFKEYYGDEEQHYYCAVREEGYRVYIVEEEATEEQLIYDFSHWGENVTLTYNDLKYGRDGGKRRERFLPGQVEFTVCKYIGEDLDLSYGAGVWVVGVGAAIENPFAFESLYILYDEPRFGKHISVYTCMKDGKYVYIDDWRASHGSPITAIEDRINIDNSSKSSHLYDLQGRRLSTQPTKGVYIQNGKKVVIK